MKGGGGEKGKKGIEKGLIIPVRIYHCAYIESVQGAVEDCRLNSTMLKNIERYWRSVNSFFWRVGLCSYRIDSQTWGSFISNPLVIFNSFYIGYSM